MILMVMLGGLAVGESQKEMFKILEETVGYLPKQPRYLMGVGTPSDILGAVSKGIDMFDCVLPTRLAGQDLLLRGQAQLILKIQNIKKTHHL